MKIFVLFCIFYFLSEKFLGDIFLAYSKRIFFFFFLMDFILYSYYLTNFIIEEAIILF